MAKENANTEESKRERITWIKRYETASKKDGFDVNKWTGRLIGERLEKACQMIHSIGTPLMSSEVKLPSSDKGIDFIESQLQTAVDKLVEELRAGKRNAVKSNTVVPF